MRNIFYSRTAFNQQRELLEHYKRRIADDDTTSTQPHQKTRCKQHLITPATKLKIAITTISTCQFAYISLSIITSLLYHKELITKNTSLVLVITAFILGVIPESISSTANSIDVRSSIEDTRIELANYNTQQNHSDIL